MEDFKGNKSVVDYLLQHFAKGVASIFAKDACDARFSFFMYLFLMLAPVFHTYLTHSCLIKSLLSMFPLVDLNFFVCIVFGTF